MDFGSLKFCLLFHCAAMTASLLFIPSYSDFPVSSGCGPAQSVQDQARVMRKTVERDLMRFRPIECEALERQAGLVPIPELEACFHLAYLEP